MDVLKPDILVVGGIRYRVNPGQSYYEVGHSTNEKFVEEQYFDEYNDTPACGALSDDEDIEKVEGGRFKCSFHIPKTYFPYIIGSKGATKKRLETETHSKILIPKLGQHGAIVVTGAKKKDVASAKRRILLMVFSKRQNQDITHFLSLPLNKPNIISGYIKFKEEVLKNYGDDAGITEDIFQNPHRLHATFAVLVLLDEVERTEAASALQECKDSVIGPLLENHGELHVIMSGLEIMNDDPSAVNVLYGKIKLKSDDFLLQELADRINNFFMKKGLLVREKENVKLHCTLMNNKFRESTSNESPKISSFDATNILQDLGDFYFGEDMITSIELSMLYSASKDSYFKATSSVTIP